MADIKQYVNLDPNDPDQLKELKAERAGPRVTVEAKIDKKIAGVPIIFTMECSPDNVAKPGAAGPILHLDNYHPALRIFMQHGIPGVGNPRMARRRIPTDANGVASLELILSMYGGDEFTVKAFIQGKEDNELASDKYITWRRIYYQVSRFKAGTLGKNRTGDVSAIPHFPWGPVKAEFEARRHNIELVDDSSTDLVLREYNVIDANDPYTHLKRTGRRGYDPKREPLALRVVLVNRIADQAVRNYTLAGKKEGEKISNFVLDRYLWKDETKDDNKDAIIGVWYRPKGESNWRHMDRKHVTTKFPNTLSIDLTNFKIPKKHIFDFWRSCDIYIKCRVYAGGSNGLSWHNAIWLAHDSMISGNYSNGGKQNTTIHEIGHFVEMAAPGQSTHYIEHGHQGPHCYQGLSATDIAKASYSGCPGTCVMFGEGDPNAPSLIDFCSVCDPQVRTRKVDGKPMPAGWTIT